MKELISDRVFRLVTDLCSADNSDRHRSGSLRSWITIHSKGWLGE
jgi:hypothetical protein